MDRNWNLQEIVAVMRRGGFYDRVMSAGPALDRVKAYLQVFAGERPEAPGRPLQHPNYPVFPGLSGQGFHDGPPIEGARRLEAAFEAIRAEALALRRADYLRYAPPKMATGWYVYMLHHMGVPLETLNDRCPQTVALLGSLPDRCLDYPWGDAALSLHGGGSHLGAHCSVDNVRVRCHLAIRVPDGCAIRVGDRTRGWQEGKTLLFDDSFEHEVWHHGTGDRVVLIVDFWHPELTPAERRALTAGFRKAEVRRLIYRSRLHAAERPETHLQFLESAIAAQDDDPLIQEFWAADPT